MRIRSLLLGACLPALLLALPASAEEALSPPTRAEVDAVRAQGRYLATITMANGGVIEVVLEGREMPYTVANFTKLAGAKFYDGLTFHEAEPRFVIRGGDPFGDGSGGAGYPLRLELSPFLGHKRGAITMFREDAPDSASSQFILLRRDLPFIDGSYAVFGWVKRGMEVVDAVKEKDVMRSVTVAPYAGTEPCPLLLEYVPPKFPPPTKAEIDAVRAQGRYLATITMANGGVIEVVLEGKEAPLTVANLVKLAGAKYYDGLTFHRVDAGFVIQGGDPASNGTGGPGYTIKRELVPHFKHRKGAISMARSDAPNSAGSQFFITLADTPQLDGGYAVFGWVKRGMEVVEGVKVGDTMKTVTVVPYQGTEACPLVVQ